MRLTRLQLQNFKACRNIDLELAPLTVLIGANNAGKSSILHALALQAQSAPIGRAQPVGTLVDLGNSLEALVHRDGGRVPAVPAEIRLTWANENQQAPQVNFTTQIGTRGEISSSFRVELQPGSGSHALVDADSGGATVSIDAQRERVRTTVLSPWSVGLVEIGQTVGVQQALREADPYLSQFVVEALRRFRYVGANRHVESSVFPLGVQPVANPHTAQELVDTLAYDDELLERVSERAQTIFGYGVDKDLVENRQITLVAKGRTGSRNVVNLGTGFIQTVWLLTQLELTLQQPPGDAWSITPLVGVEEPELHIHPALQPDIASLLGNFVRAGLNVICTTQSEHLLLAVLSQVLEGTVAADSVLVYYLRDGTADRLTVDDQGRIEGGLRGFFEANEEQLRRHIELLKQRG